jgi:hypothetical protein
MLRSKKWSWLKAWAMQIARRRGMKKAIVALARRLAASHTPEGPKGCAKRDRHVARSQNRLRKLDPSVAQLFEETRSALKP